MRTLLFTGLLSTAILASTMPAVAGDDTLLGTAAGAALGGFIGSQVSHGRARLPATVAGVLIGGAVGNSVGQSYERNSYPVYGSGYYAQSSYYAQPAYYGPPGYYRSAYVPNYVAPVYAEPVYAPPVYTQAMYAQPVGVQPQSTTYVDDETGNYCREYSQRIQIGSQTQESYGTACMQPDGTWRIVSTR